MFHWEVVRALFPSPFYVGFWDLDITNLSFCVCVWSHVNVVRSVHKFISLHGGPVNPGLKKE